MTQKIQLQEIKDGIIDKEENLIITPDTIEFYDLENQYNQYRQRVIYVPNNITVEYTLRELRDYVASIKKCNTDKIKLSDSQIMWDSDDRTQIQYLWDHDIVLKRQDLRDPIKKHLDFLLENRITITVIKENNWLISFWGSENWSKYGRDIYFHINEFFKSMVEKKCPKCGEPIVGKGKFCSGCGIALS